ncbi:GNAT family N-acetyltransferase [Oceanobacillus jeddahense]|uniref:GNAT family N-acetyltransferase n=1 Tax=Oceanobacillus jeddahense TaxID=1462527 RepID=A0ABY5JYB0_9BACI|nr:GNAT family N-acetyltransferase [Oceanobacillus jeddahense]UUI04046.1 GNAT family N-acetyltransferase [Oceanobacillus jeddahense]
MSKIHITDFQQEDIAEIVDLFYATVHEINCGDYSEDAIAAWAPLEGKTNLLKSWEHDLLKNKTFVAKIEKQIVGFIDIRADGYLDRLYVHKDKQRMGIASALLREVEKWAIKEEIPLIWTFSSITAKGFFEKNSFEVVEKENVERKGTVLSRFKMKKMLIDG